MDSISFIFNSLLDTLQLLVSFWWLYIPALLIWGGYIAFENYNQAKYIAGLKWILLEIRFPRDLHKSPRAMEQVFAALHAITGEVKKWKDRFIGGKIPDSLSLEIVGISGQLHFYIRTLEEHRNLVEAQIYAHYPEAEITQGPDYIADLPGSVPSDKYDIAGGELALTKEDAYPIKTYPEFEETGGGREDVKRIDPLASLSEFLSTLQPGEIMAVQYIISPTGDEWVKKGKKVVDKLMEKKGKPPKDYFSDAIYDLGTKIPGSTPADKKENKKEEKKEEKKFSDLNPGVQDTIKAIERSFNKLAFKTGIRFAYIASKDRFNKGRPAGVIGTFKQFSTQSLNGFKSGFTPGSKDWFFKAQKEYASKAKFYDDFRQRSFPKTNFSLTTEELATIFHFPDIGVQSPSLPRIEAKKGEPPSGLPVI